MRKLINETKRINLDDLVQELQNSNKLIVYYRSSNQRDGVPSFLQTDGQCWFFRSAINNYRPTYEHPSARETLAEATKSRDIYVIDKEEANKLFKLQTEIE